MHATPLKAVIENESATSADSGKYWWDQAQARRCGRLWCSDVVSAYMPLASSADRIILAVQPSLESNGRQARRRVEARSTAVATTLSEVIRSLSLRLRQSGAIEQKNSNFGDSPKLHPLTPEIAIGQKNNNPVLFLPANEDLGNPQIILVTLTEPDAQASQENIDILAKRWKKTFEQIFSKALWGLSFDLKFPWARAAVAFLMVMLAVLATRLTGQYIQAFEKSEQLQEVSLKRSIQLYATHEQNNVQSKLVEQQRLERRRVRQNLRIKCLQVFRVSIFAMALFLSLWLFPQTRLYGLETLLQFISLPLLWLGIIGIESLLAWWMIRHLNRWSRVEQAADPDSDRPGMRLQTNARVLRGSLSVATAILGIYLTLLLFGINPQVLAGAGIIAVALGFLARNLVEDMISGATILYADLFAIGDFVKTGTNSGLVESMNLMRTELRGSEGEVISIPNRMIQITENRSKDWSRVNFEIDISWESDTDKACQILQSLALAMKEDPEWSAFIIDEPLFLGIERLDQSGVRLKLWIKTEPLKQWVVSRELRRRIKLAYDDAGIRPGMPHQQVNVVP